MALVNCRECGKEISKRAHACPHCGYKLRRTRLVTWLGTIFVAIPLAIAIFASWIAPPKPELSGSFTNQTASPNPEPPETATPKPESPAQAAARKKQDRAAQLPMAGAIALKKAMRDPESFKLESALQIESTGAVCYEYRSKNGFGGVNVGQAVLSADGKNFKTDEEGGFTTLWNKECANRSGTETAAGIRLLRAW